MIAALVITGSEMLSGFRQDALVQPFATMLRAKGIAVREVRMIADEPSGLVKAITALDADIIVVTGGLGMTPDDTTHMAVTSLQGGSRVIPIDNPVGSAPGIDLMVGGKRIVFLPGVPAEAQAMFSNLLAEFPDKGKAMVDIPVFGLREVEIAQRLGSLAEQCGFLPRDMEITLVAPVNSEPKIREILGRHCLEEPDLSTTFGALLKQRGLAFASAESCTGGLIGHLVTQVPGSSDYFRGSIVAYSDDVKTKVLGVPEDLIKAHGAVSEEVAQAMLRGVLDLTGADVGVATTGIAGPTGGTAEKPVGMVWIAVGSREKHLAVKHQFAFTRAGNKLISAKAALYMLRLLIYDQDLHRSAFA